MTTATKIPEAAGAAQVLERARAARERLGERVLVLGHHYQVDEVIRFADATGDSFKLARVAADSGAEYVVFCGVHFMAESADILTAPWQKVLLPDLAAGCSMADMADADQTETAWESLQARGRGRLVPVTYMNSSAAIKAFCGRHGGVVCTSSNARRVLEWAYGQGERVLFLPDQHLGRNVAFHDLGMSLEEMAVWDPHALPEENAAAGCDRARLVLWKGHCSVHTKFLPAHVDALRRRHPDIRVISHPECVFGVVAKSDAYGSTEHIIRTVESSPPGSRWAVGTEFNLVARLARRNPDKKVVSLSGINCLCSTMYRISPEALAGCLEGLLEGRMQHLVSVPEDVAAHAQVALDRMLALT